MIDFFTKFPKIPYEIDGISREITNIVTAEIAIIHGIELSYILWKKEIFEGDTPIIVADELYKKPEYYWTILYINNIVNPFTDWYMTQTELEKYTDVKYQNSGGKYGTHHYEIRFPNKPIRIADDIERKSFEQMQTLPEYVFKITNFEYERRKNEERRRITVINPRYINDFVDKFHQTVSKKV